jgi:hypothetical protein
MLILGSSIVANGFALFLYFPLYLGLAGVRATNAMATYLLGFAFGGLCGGLILEAGGYPALSAAILISGLIALFPRLGLHIR